MQPAVKRRKDRLLKHKLYRCHLNVVSHLCLASSSSLVILFPSCSSSSSRSNAAGSDCCSDDVSTVCLPQVITSLSSCLVSGIICGTLLLVKCVCRSTGKNIILYFYILPREMFYNVLIITLCCVTLSNINNRIINTMASCSLVNYFQHNYVVVWYTILTLTLLDCVFFHQCITRCS